MVEVVSTVPRIETQLYLDYQGDEKYLLVNLSRNKFTDSPSSINYLINFLSQIYRNPRW